MAKPFANEAWNVMSEWSAHRARNDFNNMLFGVVQLVFIYLYQQSYLL